MHGPATAITSTSMPVLCSIDRLISRGSTDIGAIIPQPLGDDRIGGILSRSAHSLSMAQSTPADDTLSIKRSIGAATTPAQSSMA